MVSHQETGPDSCHAASEREDDLSPRRFAKSQNNSLAASNNNSNARQQRPIATDNAYTKHHSNEEDVRQVLGDLLAKVGSDCSSGNDNGDNSSNIINNNNNSICNESLRSSNDGDEANHSTIVNVSVVSQTSSLIVGGGLDAANTKTSIVTPINVGVVFDDDDVAGGEEKQIVTLRNLEITPPPQPPPATNNESTVASPEAEQSRRNKSGSRSQRSFKRSRSESTEQSDDQASNTRSKRQRRQTQLFQVEDKSKHSSAKPNTANNQPERSSTSSSRKRSTPSSNKLNHSQTKSTKQHQSQLQTQQQQQQQQPPQQLSHDLQDVIFYEKNDYLAIRNEENTFFLCQLTENVRVQRPFIKVRWLDTKDDGKTYFLTSHYDKVPQKSIIMPVILNRMKGTKKSDQIFSLDDQHKENIMDRLRRSLNVPSDHEQN